MGGEYCILFEILTGKEYDCTKKLVQRILSQSDRRHWKKFIYTFGFEGDRRMPSTKYTEYMEWTIATKHDLDQQN
jgi:hypothetical protein